MTLKEVYDQGTAVLTGAGIASPEVDAFYLLEHVTGINRTRYLFDKDKPITADEEARYMEEIAARARHIPYQYITGSAPFMGLDVKVNENVLIPRLDTEVLCEETIKLIPEGGRVMDLCTGSGCIAIAIKAARPDASVRAIDISQEALALAKENAKLNGTEIHFEQSDLFEGSKEADAFDVIVSNPPYVSEEEYASLDEEVKGHEPALALLAGSEGLDIYKRLIPDSLAHLAGHGYLIMEIGCSQGAAVKELMENAGFEDVHIIKDLAGLDRVAVGKKIDDQGPENSCNAAKPGVKKAGEGL